MRKTTNYNLSLYEPTDKMVITAEENSLNANMEIIDKTLKEKATIQDMTNYIEAHKDELKGDKGDTGSAGTNGTDGVGISSVVQTTTSHEDGGTNIIKVNKTNGTASTFAVKNGSKGSTGEKGADGYTPIKGTDYWTEEDQQEIKEYVLTNMSSEYVTETELNNKKYLTNVPSEYKTKTENDSLYQAKGNYLTSYTETDPTVPSHVKSIKETDISKWNNKSDFSGSYNDLTNKPTIPTVPTKVSAFENDKNYLTSIPSEYITESELNAKNYLTSIPSTYKTKTENDALYQAKGDYLTEEDKESFVQDDEIFEEVGRTSISNNLCDGVYEWGSLQSNGSEGSLTEGYGYRTANFLPVEGGRKILWNADLTTNGNANTLYCICEYDEDKNFVLHTRSIQISVNKWDTGKGITLQANTKYVRFYIYNGTNTVKLDSIKINLFYAENIGEFFAGGGDVFNYVPHIIVDTVGKFIPLAKIQSPLTGKKIVYDGDSICIGTHGGGGYAKIIADRVGGYYINQAVGGGRLRTLAGSSDNFHSVVDNLENLPNDGDLYCFEGGVNDFWTHGVLGTYELNDFTGELDETTVCGALETIFRYSLNTFIGKPICFVITHKIQRTAYGKNPEGNTFKEYHDAIVGICEKYSIPYYDAFYESGLNGWNEVQNQYFLTGNSSNTPDGCHPNEEGYKRYYVPQLISLFESLMPQNTGSIVAGWNDIELTWVEEKYATFNGVGKTPQIYDINGYKYATISVKEGEKYKIKNKHSYNANSWFTTDSSGNGVREDSASDGVVTAVEEEITIQSGEVTLYIGGDASFGYLKKWY